MVEKDQVIPCPECGYDGEVAIPIWENLAERDGQPDYLGCKDCNSMIAYEKWWPPDGGSEPVNVRLWDVIKELQEIRNDVDSRKERRVKDAVSTLDNVRIKVKSNE